MVFSSRASNAAFTSPSCIILIKYPILQLPKHPDLNYSTDFANSNSVSTSKISSLAGSKSSDSLDFGSRLSNFLSASADFVWTANFRSAKAKKRAVNNQKLTSFHFRDVSSANPPTTLKRLEFRTKLFSFQLLFFRLGRNLGDHFRLHLVDDLWAEHSRDGASNVTSVTNVGILSMISFMATC